MITLNEEHNMEAVLNNIRGWAQELFLIDSYSSDRTVDIALQHGVHVVQRRFRGYGDQWNYALEQLPISSPWTMKLDPDERLTDELKQAIADALIRNNMNALAVRRRLWFMGARLPVSQTLIRIWRTGRCRFSDVLVNEHPLINGRVETVQGELDHHDSPDLHHWYDKQNRYSTAEALSAYRDDALSAEPRLLGPSLERRMWVKKVLLQLPFRSLFVFLYCYFGQGAWRAGRVGLVWASLRASVHRMIALKLLEMQRNNREIKLPLPPAGHPHPGAFQADQPACEKDHRTPVFQNSSTNEANARKIQNGETK